MFNAQASPEFGFGEWFANPALPNGKQELQSANSPLPRVRMTERRSEEMVEATEGIARPRQAVARRLHEFVFHTFGRTRLAASIVLLAWFVSGCAVWPFGGKAEIGVSEKLMAEIRSRPNKVFLLTSVELMPSKPVVLLLHGATEDPSEMMNIAGLWSRTHNVLLYSYNFHQSLDDVAGDLLEELQRIALQRGTTGTTNSGMTVITYSYSAAVFRKAVLLAPRASLFRDVSLIQLVPTAGGSALARRMGNAVAKSLVSVASKPSAAENPYGKTAEALWGDAGTRVFNQRIDPRRVFTVLVPRDPHSLADIDDDAVRKRYENGIGRNVVIIPARYRVTHDNAPHHPVAMDYLTILQSSLADMRRIDTSKTPAGTN